MSTVTSENSDNVNFSHSSIWQKLCSFHQKITVEPVLLLFNIASYAVWITSQDLMIQKTCSVNFGYTDNICLNLNDFEDLQNVIQSKVSNFLMWKSILEASLKIITVPILGWWGDKWGRKGPLILCLTALGLESVTLLLNALMSSWPLEAVLASAFFYGLSGGTHGLLMLAFSLMAQITSAEKRTMRMGILDGFYYLGTPLGLALAPPIFKMNGYAGVFGTAIVIYMIGVVYVLIRIPRRLQQSADSVDDTQRVDSACFGLDKIFDAVQTTFFKHRANKATKFILVCILAMLLDSFVIWGEANVKYLFAKKALHWDYKHYSFFSSLSSFLTIVGALVIVPIITLKTRWSDAVIGVLGASSRALERLFYSLATSPNRSWLMYAGCAFGIASPLAPIAIRSLLSKLAYEDIGQVYSVMAIGETLLPFGAAPAYNALYNHSLGNYPGSFYLLSLLLNASMGFCFLYFLISKYTLAENEG